MMTFKGRDIISMNDLTREEIDAILGKVDIVQKHPRKSELCRDKVC
ncbi:MAG: aspartate carbamoyltransferase, partial [Deltaproteobacteria bacterium]|nr:aspartate carbamoyltransferase [Deltaproteobacteria bacterium]